MLVRCCTCFSCPPYCGTTVQIAEGYPLETYQVNTKDGWVLSLYRIPHGKYRNTKPGKRPVIYLHHGITLSSACFTLLNSNESMAYILADAGGWEQTELVKAFGADTV